MSFAPFLNGFGGFEPKHKRLLHWRWASGRSLAMTWDIWAGNHDVPQNQEGGSLILGLQQHNLNVIVYQTIFVMKLLYVCYLYQYCSLICFCLHCISLSSVATSHVCMCASIILFVCRSQCSFICQINLYFNHYFRSRTII